MKESIWGYWIVVLDISIFAIMILLQNYSITDEQSFFLVKESLSAAMKESVDYGYIADSPKKPITPDNYKDEKNYGRLKINREKVIENFIRRFAESVDINKTYNINFYNVSEVPPCISVEVTANTTPSSFGKWQTAADTEVVTSSRFTGILFTTEDYNYCWDFNNDGKCD